MNLSMLTLIHRLVTLLRSDLFKRLSVQPGSQVERSDISYFSHLNREPPEFNLSIGRS